MQKPLCDSDLMQRQPRAYVASRSQMSCQTVRCLIEIKLLIPMSALLIVWLWKEERLNEGFHSIGDSVLFTPRQIPDPVVCALHNFMHVASYIDQKGKIEVRHYFGASAVNLPPGLVKRS